MRQYKHVRKEAKFINISAGSEERPPSSKEHRERKPKILKRKSKLKVKPISHANPLKQDSHQNQNKRYTSNTHCYNVDHSIHEHLDFEINGMSDVSREGNYDESQLRGESPHLFKRTAKTHLTLIRQEDDDGAHFTTIENFHKSANNILEHSYSVLSIDENEASTNKFLVEDHERYYLMSNGNQRVSSSLYEHQDAINVFSDTLPTKHRHRKKKQHNSVRHKEMPSTIPVEKVDGKGFSRVDAVKRATRYLENGIYSPGHEKASRELSRRYQWKKQVRNSSPRKRSSKKKERRKGSTRKNHRRKNKKVGVGDEVSNNRKLGNDLAFQLIEHKRNKPQTHGSPTTYNENIDESRHNRWTKTERWKQSKRGRKRTEDISGKKKSHTSRIYEKMKTTKHFLQPELPNRSETNINSPGKQRTSKNNKKAYNRSAKQTRRAMKQQMMKDVEAKVNDFNNKGACFSDIVSKNHTQEYWKVVTSDEVNRNFNNQTPEYIAHENLREELRHRSKRQHKDEKRSKKSRTADKKKRHPAKVGQSLTKNGLIRSIASGRDRRVVSPKSMKISRCDMVQQKPKRKGGHSRQVSAPVFTNRNLSFSINWKPKDIYVEPRSKDQDWRPKTENSNRPRNKVSVFHYENSPTRDSRVDTPKKAANYVQDVSKHHLNIHHIPSKLGSSSLVRKSADGSFYHKSDLGSTVTDESFVKAASKIQDKEKWDESLAPTSSRTDRKCEQESSKWSFLLPDDDSDNDNTNSKNPSRSASILSSLSSNIAYKLLIGENSFDESSSTEIDESIHPKNDREHWLLDDDRWQKNYESEFESDRGESSLDGPEQSESNFPFSSSKKPSEGDLFSKRSSLRSRTQVIDSARQYPIQVSRSPRKDTFSSTSQKLLQHYNGALPCAKEIPILEGRKE